MSAIPEDWIKRYVDQLLAIAAKMPEGGAMQTAALMRADHAMDLVKAWRERQPSTGSESRGEELPK